MHPTKQIMMENKLEVHKDRTLKEAVGIAYKVCCAYYRILKLLDVIFYYHI